MVKANSLWYPKDEPFVSRQKTEEIITFYYWIIRELSIFCHQKIDEKSAGGIVDFVLTKAGIQG